MGIERLPVETLIDVFTHIYKELSAVAKEKWDEEYPLRDLRLVSHTWLNVITHTPQLWTVIVIRTRTLEDFQGQNSRRRLASRLKRSGTLGLDITVVMPYPMRIPATYELLAPHAHRWDSLVFIELSPIRAPSNRDFLHEFFVIDKPLLRTLVIPIFAPDRFYTWPSVQKEILSPGLLHLTSPYNYDFSEPAPRLRSLTIQSMDDRPHALDSVLRHSHDTLEYLDLTLVDLSDYLSPSDTAGLVHLKKLSWLRISFRDPYLDWRVFTNMFHAPTLRTMTLLYPPRVLVPGNIPPFPQLRDLRWLHGLFNEPALRRFLELCPNLTSLRDTDYNGFQPWRNVPMVAGTFQRELKPLMEVDPTTKKPSLCPLLEELAVDTIFLEDVNELCARRPLLKKVSVVGFTEADMVSLQSLTTPLPIEIWVRGKRL
ncbi:hypothetical protein FRB99_003318 [Tulasnella sp. 403]|nr:hypothetical protein FRB99_003318 [Tulasnella sp. 403]